MAPKTKLELTWIGKENRPKLEPRILMEDREKYYHNRTESPTTTCSGALSRESV
jgi:adenine-specific DNA-methyltransferase